MGTDGAAYRGNQSEAGLLDFRNFRLGFCMVIGFLRVLGLREWQGVGGLGFRARV